LRERGIEDERARLLSRLAEGRPERGLAFADDAKRFEKRQELLEEASALGGMGMGDLMDMTERMSRQFRERREAVFERLSAWLSWWRDVLLVQSGAEDSAANIDLLERLRSDAQRYEREVVTRFVHAVLKCRERLEANVQARIALDAMAVRAPRERAGQPTNT
jgi:DNA polymerase-3 subunit delta'